MFALIFTSILSLAHAQTANNNWFTDLAEATEYATKNDRQILMVFAGSDWCRPCIKFKKDILLSTDFEKYADDKLAILYLDFPSKRKNKLSIEASKHNEALASKYNSSGIFPKVLLMDAKMNQIKEIKYSNQNAQDILSQF